MDTASDADKAFKIFYVFIICPLKGIAYLLRCLFRLCVFIIKEMATEAMETKTNQRAPVQSASRQQHINKVMPSERPLHLKRGWSQKGNAFNGYYRTRHGAWRGNIIRRGDKFDVGIFSPPKDRMKKHPKWECFFRKERGWYQIHLHKNPKDKDIGAIIFYVEKIINESFEI